MNMFQCEGGRRCEVSFSVRTDAKHTKFSCLEIKLKNFEKILL